MEFRRCFISIFQSLFTLYLVSTCPTDKSEWMNRSVLFNCTEGLYYHCGLTNHGILVEFCTKPRSVPSKYCSSFELWDSNIFMHLWNCSYNIPIMTGKCSDQNLPEKRIRTDELYKYPVCFLGQELRTVVINYSSRISVAYNTLGPNIFDNATTEMLTKTQGISDNNMTENESQVARELIAVKLIAAFLIASLPINIISALFMKCKGQIEGPEKKHQIVIDDNNMYEVIDDMELQESALSGNENTTDGGDYDDDKS